MHNDQDVNNIVRTIVKEIEDFRATNSDKQQMLLYRGSLLEKLVCLKRYRGELRQVNTTECFRDAIRIFYGQKLPLYEADIMVELSKFYNTDLDLGKEEKSYLKNLNDHGADYDSFLEYNH